MKHLKSISENKPASATRIVRQWMGFPMGGGSGKPPSFENPLRSRYGLQWEVFAMIESMRKEIVSLRSELDDIKAKSNGYAD